MSDIYPDSALFRKSSFVREDIRPSGSELFGFLGHGKSSFINSCMYVLKNNEQFKEHAETEMIIGGKTRIRRAYEITDNITIVDNRGYCSMRDFETAVVYAQLGNLIPIGKEVKWKGTIEDVKYLMEEIKIYVKEPNDTDFIVPIFVYRTDYKISKPGMEEVEEHMQTCLKLTGMFPIVVLTNKTSGDYFEMERRFIRMGAEVVIAIENYTNVNHQKTLGKTTDILTVIYKALCNVRYCLEQPRDPMRDRMERKTFVRNYFEEAYKNKREAERKIAIDKEEAENERRRKEREAGMSLWERTIRTLFRT